MLKFHRDGYDYIAHANGIEYCVSKSYGIWRVWVNDEQQKEYYDHIADAKAWCQWHAEREKKMINYYVYGGMRMINFEFGIECNGEVLRGTLDEVRKECEKDDECCAVYNDGKGWYQFDSLDKIYPSLEINDYDNGRIIVVMDSSDLCDCKIYNFSGKFVRDERFTRKELLNLL